MTTPPPLEKLRQTVSELESELAELSTIDAETRAVLDQAAAEIQSALKKQDTSDIEPSSISDRLRLSLQEFEAEHPTFAGVLERLINALGQLGI